MSRLKGILKQLRIFVRKRRVERELDEELRVPIDVETEKNVLGVMTDSLDVQSVAVFGVTESRLGT